MQKRTMAVAVFLGFLLAQALTPGPSRGTVPPRLVAVINLQKVMAGKPAATVDAGEGVTLRLVASNQPWRQDLTILADGRKLQQLEGGRFIACARVQAGPATYWAVSEYTGGAHCCGQFAFLARAAAGRPVRFLGKTEGYNGGPRDFPGSFLYRQGQLYFEAFNDRFDYFHASHADCLLVNVPRFYYRLTPSALTVDNIPFKDVYLKEAAAVNQEIHRYAASRRGKPQAILNPGFGPGFEGLTFSDTLGQLLVKRTILYLYAREDRRAWDTFKRDVARYYRTSAWVPQLQQEIIKTMGAHPY